MRAVLTIAGSDSVAGAGLQADLKTLAALGVYGVTAITAVTAQSTSRIAEIVALTPQMVRSQIDIAAEDVEISAVKTGMLATGDIVRAVADTIARRRLPNVVVDPVFAATAGRRTLLEVDAVSILRAHLLPLATVVTPNVAEASVLSGIDVNSLSTARDAAMRIADLGPATVVVTGGHLEGPDAVDVLFHGGAFAEIRAPRAPVGDIHGAGCTFASAIAAGLAMGDDVPAAIERAKRYVTGAIEGAFRVGRGALVLNHFWERLY